MQYPSEKHVHYTFFPAWRQDRWMQLDEFLYDIYIFFLVPKTDNFLMLFLMNLIDSAQASSDGFLTFGQIVDL